MGAIFHTFIQWIPFARQLNFFDDLFGNNQKFSKQTG